MTLRRTWHEHKAKYLMLTPFTIIFLIFTVFPVLASVVLSLTSFNMVEWPELVFFKTMSTCSCMTRSSSLP